jgi:CHRD domain-containing protein
MKRAALAIVLALVAAACGSSTTAPTTPSNPTFTAQLLPSNETPPITNAESVASGNVTITFVTTKDATGAVTSAVGTAVVNLQGFPAGSSITVAHIHTGAVGVAGGVLVAFIPSSVTLTNGAGSFTQTNNLTGDQATNIMNNPAGFYFNVHTALNPGGVMRGQLVRTQ